MSEALSAEDLKAIRERANHAGGGPWEIFQHGDGSWLIRHYAGGMVADAGFSNANADFIAHSRTDIPALLAEIARRSKIEERAKDVAGLPAGTGEYSPTRLRSETAQYILEGDLHTQTTKGDT